ncbi:hypothetical protein [Pseudoxanthomonas japonensis]|uniref:hypothetical protein n=1 Tax=Pseudoxanthomonas japonensis TaxID=69284 RepID=UPI003747D520
MATLWLLAAPAMAQDAATPAGDPQATTLETMVVRPEPEEVVDLYRFRNPVEVESGALGRSWKEPTSLEQLGKNGGIVPVLVGLAARQVQKGARKIPGWKEPEQPAVARPPPLDDAQAARALRLYESNEPSR